MYGSVSDYNPTLSLENSGDRTPLSHPSVDRDNSLNNLEINPQLSMCFRRGLSIPRDPVSSDRGGNDHSNGEHT